MKILAISGSAREASTNTALLRVMKNLAPTGVELLVLHRLNALPVFSPDSEGEATPAEVREFMEAVSTSDGIIISSPEYVRAIPGGSKMQSTGWFLVSKLSANLSLWFTHPTGVTICWLL